jgi:hypothetical protein
VPTRPERITPRIRFLFDALAVHLSFGLPSLDRGLTPPSVKTCPAHTPGLSRAGYRVGSRPWLGGLLSSGCSIENKLIANIESWQEPTVVCVQFFHEVWVVEILRVLIQEATLGCARLREV